MYGRLHTKAITVQEHLKALKEYKLRVYATTLAPGVCSTCSDVEFTLCFGSLMKASDELPSLWFTNVLKRIFGKLTTQGDQWTKKPRAIVHLISPRPPSTASSNSGSPDTADVELKPENWPMPTGLPDVPLARLSAKDRWEVTADFLLNELFPCLLPQEEKATDILLALREELLPLASAVERSEHVELVISAMGITCAPFQPEPLTSSQFQHLTDLKTERCPQKLRVLTELMHEGWWSKMVRMTLSFSMREVQHGPVIQRALVDLQTFHGDFEQNHARVWDTLMSESGLRRWLVEMRSQATTALLETAATHLQKRLAAAVNSEEHEARELVRITTWMATSLQSEKWVALQHAASKLMAELTADSRWNESTTAIKALLAQRNTGASAPGIDTQAFEEHAQAITLRLSTCHGYKADMSDIQLFEEAVDACMNMVAMTASIAEACKSMLTFTGERHDGERMLMCNVISEGLKLQELCREFGNSPEPKDYCGTHTRTMAALSAYTEAFKALSRSGDVQELSAGQVVRPKTLVSLALFEEAQEHLVGLCQAWAASYAQQQVRSVKTTVANLQGVLVPWKDRLCEQPTWAQIVDEIQYHFWRTTADGQQPPIDKLNTAYTASTKALDDYLDACKKVNVAIDSVVETEAKAMQQKAMCQNTEEYFVRQIEQNPQTCDAKLTSRQQKVADKFDYDTIHHVIRQEVKKRTGV